VVGSGVEQDVDVSGARGLSSIVKIDDGAISISVPEPGTMTTLGTGLATIAFLICKKSKRTLFYIKPLSNIPICSGLLTESTVWK
jgi:hypothetical protein